MRGTIGFRTRLLGATSAVAATVLLTAAPAVAADPPPPGALTQADGAPGCIDLAPAPDLSRARADGRAEGDCATGTWRGEMRAVATSPDGRWVFGVSNADDDSGDGGTLVVMRRNETTGELTQEACFETQSVSMTPGCTPALGLEEATQLAVSPDGRNIYVSSAGNGVGIFGRTPADGNVFQVAGPDPRPEYATACVSRNDEFAGCLNPPGSRALNDANGVVVSPNGKNVYVGAGAGSSRGAVVTFDRDPDTGALKLTDCIGTTDTYCGDAAEGAPAFREAGDDIAEVSALAITADGKNLYVASQDSGTTPDDTNGTSISSFNRDATSGLLTQLDAPNGCLNDGDVVGCTSVRGVTELTNLAVSADGRSLYGAAPDSPSHAVARLDRVPATGVLSQLPTTDPAACFTRLDNGATETCTEAAGFDEPLAVAVSPDNANVYVGGEASHSFGRPVDTSGTSGLAAFSRGTDDALKQLEAPYACAQPVVVSDCTATIRGATDVRNMVVGPDGEWVYTAAPGSNAIAVLHRTDPPPVCSDVSKAVAYQTPTNVPLTCVDANGAELTFSIPAAPSHGTLGAIDQAARTVLYTPAAGYSGPDSFQFTAADGPAAEPSETATPAVARLDVASAPAPGGAVLPETVTRPPRPVACRSARSLIVHPRSPGHVRLLRSTLTLAGKRFVAKRVGTRLRFKLDFSGRSPEVVTVTIRSRTQDGRLITESRRYKTCAVPRRHVLPGLKARRRAHHR